MYFCTIRTMALVKIGLIVKGWSTKANLVNFNWAKSFEIWHSSSKEKIQEIGSRATTSSLQSINYSPRSFHWTQASLTCAFIELRTLCVLQSMVLKNGPTLGLFFVYFRSFQTNNAIFTTNQCKKCPSTIPRWDSNQHHLEHESSPLTTRPGLPPFFQSMIAMFLWNHMGKDYCTARR